MHTITEAPLEAVGIQQRQEALEVRFLAVVRRGCHQQQVPRDVAQQPAESVAFGLFQGVAEEGG